MYSISIFAPINYLRSRSMDFHYPNNNWKPNCNLTQKEEEKDADWVTRFRVL